MVWTHVGNIPGLGQWDLPSRSPRLPPLSLIRSGPPWRGACLGTTAPAEAKSRSPPRNGRKSCTQTKSVVIGRGPEYSLRGSTPLADSRAVREAGSRGGLEGV
eukprot:1176238-Prorocentrum_minimum.AAC.1